MSVSPHQRKTHSIDALVGRATRQVLTESTETYLANLELDANITRRPDGIIEVNFNHPRTMRVVKGKPTPWDEKEENEGEGFWNYSREGAVTGWVVQNTGVFTPVIMDGGRLARPPSTVGKGTYLAIQSLAFSERGTLDYSRLLVSPRADAATFKAYLHHLGLLDQQVIYHLEPRQAYSAWRQVHAQAEVANS